jgi:hypothetical protein
MLCKGIQRRVTPSGGGLSRRLTVSPPSPDVQTVADSRGPSQDGLLLPEIYGQGPALRALASYFTKVAEMPPLQNQTTAAMQICPSRHVPPVRGLTTLTLGSPQ